MNARLRQIAALLVLTLALVPCIALTGAPEGAEQPDTPAVPGVRFTTVDIYVDSNDAPLAAIRSSSRASSETA